jgi:hypothetical protein
VCRCQLIDIGNGIVPTCKGDDALDAPCDDGVECSIDDKCIPVASPDSSRGSVACRGVASGLPCDDDNECTDDDTCVDIPTTNRVFGRNIVCRGTVIEGRPCKNNDYDGDDLTCQLLDDGFSSCTI